MRWRGKTQHVLSSEARNDNKIKALIDFGIPVESPSAMETVIDGLISLQRHFPSCLQASNQSTGLGKELAVIQPSVDSVLKKNAKGWFGTIVTRCVEKEGSNVSKTQVVYSLSVLLAQMDEEGFDQAVMKMSPRLRNYVIKNCQYWINVQ